MKNNYYNYVWLLCIVLTLSSCVSAKKMVYFQNTEGMQLKETLLNFEPKIQAGDVLSINVSALEAEAAATFNLYETASTNNPRALTYLVNNAGEINFPVIGKIRVKDVTTTELTEKLTVIISEYIVKPIINIRLTNFKITVMGEVKAPGTYPVSNERITIIEALGLAGDLNIQGKRDTVLLIREQEGKRTFITVDLTTKKLFNSPYYYLAQNDVLYVAPNKTKINSSAVGSNAGVIISSISMLISLIAILIR